MAIALITGASAGLGRSFADSLAAAGHDLVLVARNQERLIEAAEELTGRYDVEAEVLPADLATAAGREVVAVRLRQVEDPVEILVNNAGFAANQPFAGGQWNVEQELLNVLVTAPVELTHAALPGMVERGRGAVINVSSVAAYLTSGTYSAAKAYLLTFTEAISEELAGTGVTATALCPGLTHTELHQRAGMDMAGVPEWLWVDKDDVVAEALAAAQAGRPVVVPGLQYKAMVAATKLLPRSLVRRASAATPRARHAALRR